MKHSAIALAAIICCLSSVTNAQDKIHLIDSGDIIEAKILEIGEEDIVYKRYDFQDGPDYRLSISRIAEIDFENGTKQIFTDKKAAPGPFIGFYYGPTDCPLEYRWGNFYMYGHRLSGEEFLSDYYGYKFYGKEYRTAKLQFFWGMALTMLGAASLCTTIASQLMEQRFQNDSNFQDPFFQNNRTTDNTGYVIGYLSSAACLGAGIPLPVKGNKKFNKIADDFNQNHLYHYNPENGHNNFSLMLGKTSSGGYGLALNF